jgi:hypothetical protein
LLSGAASPKNIKKKSEFPFKLFFLPGKVGKIKLAGGFLGVPTT